jgi:hypothetical protein
MAGWTSSTKINVVKSDWNLSPGCNTAEINHHFGDEEMQVCPDCKGEGEVPVTTEDIEDRKADAADHERDVEQD